jgi:hypothetical protein
MKLGRIFVIALLAGTLGVIGCNDEEGTGGTAGSGGTAGTGGTAGSGGTGGTVDPCVGGQCDRDSQAKTNCQDAIDACNMLGAGGAGGAGGAPLTPAECDALGAGSFCTEGTGGTGGTGGAAGAGGTGGAGGSGVEGCNEGLCLTDPERRAQCEVFIPACLIHCETESCGEDECIGIALLFICNE